MKGITLQAIFAKAQTTVDGGWRITFDAAESEAAQIMQLSQYRDTLLQLALIPLEGMFDGEQPMTDPDE